MKTWLVLMVLPAALAAADWRIDHATVCGTQVDVMRQALRAVANVGAEYGGPHANHATEMALASFPDGSYLELMGIQAKPDPAAVAAHVWSRFLRNNAGPCAFALRAADMDREIAQLKSAGIRVGTPEKSGRTRPDGVQISWETVDAGPGARGGLFPFLIRDFTPRENRAFPSGKPTTTRFGGISKVVIGVGDLDSATAQYRKAYGLAAPRRQRDAMFGADLAWFEETPFVLAQGLGGDSWLSRRVREYGDAPCAFVLESNAGGVEGNLSTWFGHPILWTNEARLGWRLGIEAQR
jgi:Glyoxalase-like domain